MIGEVSGDYVRAADSSMVRPRFRWKGWAAACAALALCAYPVWRMAHTDRDLNQDTVPPLHAYTVMESGGSALTGQAKITAQSDAAAPEPATAPEKAGGELPIYPAQNYLGSGIDDTHYNDSGEDIPVEEGPCNQYNSLYENACLDQYPEWYGGAYIDHNDSGEPSKLVVCIVDGFHTPDLEQQIAEWCGDGVLAYRDVKYSRGYLQQLMEQLNGSQFLPVLEADKAISGWGVYEGDNCIQMDCTEVPNDASLAALAKLDPKGDAIRVRVFAGQSISPDNVKGTVPEPAAESAPGGVKTEPGLEPTPTGVDERGYPADTGLLC